MDYDLTVLIPTFNEEGNIEKIIRRVDGICKGADINEEILVVDDNSKDNTLDIVNGLKGEMENLSLLVRYEDHGLSQSIYDGFFTAKSGFVQVIDADFSHPPEKIPELYSLLKSGEYDMVIGSRSVEGGGLENWPLYRRTLSMGAALMAKALIPSVHDSGSGFFGINKRVLKDATFKPRGFRMGFEILGKGNWTRVAEIPITLKFRVEGESKLKFRVIIDFILQCIDIAVYNLIKRKSNNVFKSWKIFLNRK